MFRVKAISCGFLLLLHLLHRSRIQSQRRSKEAKPQKKKHQRIHTYQFNSLRQLKGFFSSQFAIEREIIQLVFECYWISSDARQPLVEVISCEQKKTAQTFSFVYKERADC